MKRWMKTLSVILLILFGAAAALAWWQRDNLKAVYVFLTQDGESLSQKREEQHQQQQDMLGKDYNVTIVAPSPEQNEALLNGKLDPNEVKQELGISEVLGETAENAEPQQAVPAPVKPAIQPEKPAEEQPAVEPEEPVEEEPPALTEEERKAQADALVNQMAAELYACEVDLMARLGEMKTTALLDWNYREPEDRAGAKMAEFGFAWLDECYELEVESDRRVKEILDRYREPLKELDVSESLLDSCWKAYCDKKTSEKAYYLNKYLG